MQLANSISAEEQAMKLQQASVVPGIGRGPFGSVPPSDKLLHSYGIASVVPGIGRGPFGSVPPSDTSLLHSYGIPSIGFMTIWVIFSTWQQFRTNNR